MAGRGGFVPLPGLGRGRAMGAPGHSQSMMQLPTSSPLARAPQPPHAHEDDAAVEAQIRALSSRLETLQQQQQQQQQQHSEADDEYGAAPPAAPPPVALPPTAAATTTTTTTFAPPIVLPDTNFEDDPAAYWDPSQLDDIGGYEPPPPPPAFAEEEPAPATVQQQQQLPSVPALRLGATHAGDEGSLGSSSRSGSTSALPSLRDAMGASAASPLAPQQQQQLSEPPLPELPETVLGIEDCPAESLVALISGTDDTADDEFARRARTKAPDMRKLRVVVCGGAASGKALWLVRALGYACARRPDADLLHRRVKHEGKIYLLEFAVSDDAFGPAEAAFRWGDAFVLVGDVESRDSFEAVKAIHGAATREREVPALPMILVMSHNESQPEETWKVTRAEAVALSETLNVPLCDVVSAAAAQESIHTLINEVLKFDLGLRTEKKPSSQQQQQQQQQQLLQQKPSSGGPVMSELEFVVLGDAFVGKTAFVGRAFGDAFTPGYTATTAKSMRKQVMRLSNEGYIIKLVDSPGFFPEQAMRMHDTNDAVVSPLENAAEMAVQWLQQQSLLQAHGFVFLFSVTSRESFVFAQELVSRIQVALVDAPGARNQVKLLLGTKKDLLHMRSVGDAEIAEAAQRLGTLHSTVSLRTGEKELLRQLFERLVNTLYGRETMQPRGGLAASAAAAIGSPALHSSSPSLGSSGSMGSLMSSSGSPLGIRPPERSSTLSARELRKLQEKAEKAARKERERLEKEAKKKAKK